MSVIWLLGVTGCSSLKVVVDRDQTIPIPPGSTWAWGTERPERPIVTSREITYTEGSLMIDLVQRATGKLAFRAIGLDQDVTQADNSDEQMTETVARTLRDLT